MPSFIAKLIDWFKHGRTWVDENTFMIPTSRDEYEYVEGDHRLRVQVERQTGKPEVVVYARTIRKWLPPYEEELLTPTDKERILGKVFQYLDQQHISYDVEGE